jgi:hypothetical protein
MAHGQPMLSGAWRSHRMVVQPSSTAGLTRHEEEIGASTSDLHATCRASPRGGSSLSGWCDVEAAGAVIHGGVHGGGGIAVVTDGDGEVLQSKGEKRGEAWPKKEGGKDRSSELTGRQGWR